MHFDWLKNPLAVLSFIILGLVLISAFFAGQIAPYPEDAYGGIDFGEKLEPVSRRHPMGTDQLGRDIFSRVIFGSRLSLGIGISTIAISLIFGVPLGLLAGYFPGKIDETIMRISDAFLAFPPLLLPIAVVAALGPSIGNMIIAISITWWPWYSRIMRSRVISVRKELYVDASKSIGAHHYSIIVHHILPNSIAPVVVAASMDVGYAILTAASLSFIGIGAQPPSPEWGLMVSMSKTYFLQFWWTATFPGLAIFLTVLAFNLLGDWLRDVLDPKESG